MDEKTNNLVKLLELYPDKWQDYDYLLQNPNIKWEIVQVIPDKEQFASIQIQFFILFSNKLFTLIFSLTISFLFFL